MKIKSYYSGKTIFLTGATGLLGKVILYKLLKEISDNIQIILLIRPQKHKTAEERFKSEVLDSECLKELKQSRSNFMEFIHKRVAVIKGDISLPDLGISQEDRKKIIKNAQIIISNAASIQWETPLNEMLQVNTYGPLQLLELAKECENLENFIQVSSVGVHITRGMVLEEQIYEPEFSVDDLLSNKMTPKEIQQLSSSKGSYEVAKVATEVMLKRNQNDATVTIVRVPGLGPSLQDPFPGYIDQVTAYSASYSLIGTGRTLAFVVNPQSTLPDVPVDYNANTILVAGARFAANKKVNVVNCILNYQLSLIEGIKVAQNYWQENPLHKKPVPFEVFENNEDYEKFIKYKKETAKTNQEIQLLNQTIKYNYLFRRAHICVIRIKSSDTLLTFCDEDDKKKFPIDFSKVTQHYYIRFACRAIAKHHQSKLEKKERPTF